MVTCGRKHTENTIAFGQNPVGCWVSGVSAAIVAGRLDFWWRVMEKNEFARASVASWSRQIQRTKKWRAAPKYQTSQHFARKKKGWDTFFSYYVLRRLQPKFEECRTIRESTEKKVKYTCLFFIRMRIYFIIIQIFQMRRQNGVYIENFTHALNAHNVARGRKNACTKIRLSRVKKVCAQLRARDLKYFMHTEAWRDRDHD